MEDFIKQLSFDTQNPFDFPDSIFSKEFKNLPNPIKVDFTNKFFQHWIVWAHQGEIDTTIVYPLILQNLIDKKYDRYFRSTSEFAQQYLQKMITEENEHAEHFLHLLQTLYPNETLIPTKQQLVVNSMKLAKTVDIKSLEELLLHYYVGECYLWAAFYLIYKQTANPKKKKLFQKLLVEESQHNNNIYKVFKQILPHVDLSTEQVFNKISTTRLFSLPFVLSYFDASTDMLKQKRYIRLVYDSPWHKQFNMLVIKKWYQLFSLLFPAVSFNEFATTVNANELEWLTVTD